MEKMRFELDLERKDSYVGMGGTMGCRGRTFQKRGERYKQRGEVTYTTVVREK